VTEDAAALARRRLRWRARRGMLENDLLISRFLDRHAAGLDEAQLRAFERLLELPDQELFELLLSRKDLDDTADKVLGAVLMKIRSVQPDRA
jgi:antitoxin CptB